MLRSLTVGAVVALLAAPVHAAPDPGAALARQLDADAPLVSRADFDQLEQLIDIARSADLGGANQTAVLISAGATALLGFDPLSKAGWFYGGFDGDGAIMASYGAIDEKSAQSAAKRGGKGAAVFWRSRILLPVDDRARADKTLGRFARLPGLTGVGSADRVLGAGAAAALRKLGVVAVGELPLVGTRIFLHRRGDAAIVDLLTPFGGVDVSWPRDRAAIEAALTRKPKGIAVTGGARTALGVPGLALWADAEAAYDAAGLLELDLDLRLRRAGLGGLPGLANRPAICASFRDVAAAGPFEDLALRAVVAGPIRRKTYRASVRVGLSWGLRGHLKLASHFLVADDQLLAPDQLGNAVLAGSVYLKSLEPIRTLPRAKVYQLERPELRYAHLGCGMRALPTSALIGWPQLLAMFVDQVAGIHPQAEALIKGTRNAAFAFRQLGLSRSGLRGTIEASFDPSAARYLESYLDALFGARVEHDHMSRPHTTWGAGPIRPYRWNKDDLAVVGAAFDPAMVDWRMSRPKPAQRSVKKLLAEIYLEPKVAVRQLIGDAPWLAPLVPLVGRMGDLALYTRFDQGTLESFAITDIR